MATEAIRPAARHQPWYKILYVQVLIAIALGILSAGSIRISARS